MESELEQTTHGLVEGGGWYVLNLRDAEWRHAEGCRGAVRVSSDDFEGWRREADQLGVNLRVAAGRADVDVPLGGRPGSLLVVSGEAVLIVEGEVSGSCARGTSCIARPARGT